MPGPQRSLVECPSVLPFVAWVGALRVRAVGLSDLLRLRPSAERSVVVFVDEREAVGVTAALRSVVLGRSVRRRFAEGEAVVVLGL